MKESDNIPEEGTRYLPTFGQESAIFFIVGSALVVLVGALFRKYNVTTRITNGLKNYFSVPAHDESLDVDSGQNAEIYRPSAAKSGAESEDYLPTEDVGAKSESVSQFNGARRRSSVIVPSHDGEGYPSAKNFIDSDYKSIATKPSQYLA